MWLDRLGLGQVETFSGVSGTRLFLPYIKEGITAEPPPYLPVFPKDYRQSHHIVADRPGGEKRERKEGGLLPVERPEPFRDGRNEKDQGKPVLALVPLPEREQKPHPKVYEIVS